MKITEKGFVELSKLYEEFIATQSEFYMLLFGFVNDKIVAPIGATYEQIENMLKEPDSFSDVWETSRYKQEDIFQELEIAQLFISMKI